jgi:hypothetical protein
MRKFIGKIAEWHSRLRGESLSKVQDLMQDIEKQLSLEN